VQPILRLRHDAVADRAHRLPLGKRKELVPIRIHADALIDHGTGLIVP
jgi:hypothetical protein